MNNNKTLSNLLISLAAFALFATRERAIALPRTQPGMALEIATDRSVYLPGELVTLSFKIKNTSPVRMSLYRPEAGKGDLEVLIRYEEGEFRTYSGPRWGREDTVAPEIDIDPGEAFEVSTTLLYNICPDTAHLSPLYVEQIRRNRLDTAYALPQPGRYSIKTRLNDSHIGETIESEPVDVLVLEPQGGDLEVWRVLEKNPELAYFIQTGGFLSRSSAERRKSMIRLLQQMAEKHPESVYAGSMRARAGNALLQD